MSKLDASKINKILIMRTDAIGDVVLITPAISAIRRKFPNAHISILVQSYTKDILENNPDINEIIIDDIRSSNVKNIFQYIGYVRKIKKLGFDLCINYYADKASYALLPFLAGIKYRISDRSRIPAGWFYNIGTYLKRKDLTKHAVEYDLDLLEPLGIDKSEPKLNIPVSIEAEKNILQKLESFGIKKDELIVGIHIGTGGSNKPWKAEGYAKVIDHLSSEHKARVIITGSQKEEAIASEVVGICKYKPVNMIAKTGLKELIALIKQYRLFIGVDSGPLHIAAGLGIPVVAISPTKKIKPTEWGPWGTRNVIVRKLIECSLPCFNQLCTSTKCLEQIKPDDVIHAAEQILEGKGNSTIEGSKADWLKRSLNVMVTCSSHDRDIMSNTEQALLQLKENDYHVILVAPKDHPLIEFAHEELIHAYEVGLKWPGPGVIRDLLKIFTEEDINLIHRMDNSGSFSLNVAFLLSTLKLPVSVLMLKNKYRKLSSVDEIIDFYKEGFHNAVI